MALSGCKIGMVLLTAIDDGGWGTAGYSGLKAICNQTHAELIVRDRIPLAQAHQAIDALARQGCRLVFGHGSELSQVIRLGATENPEVRFACLNGEFTAENLAALEMKDEEIGFLSGLLAGRLSATQKVGFIGALEIPPSLRHHQGFQAGALREGAVAIVKYTGDFFDPAKARSAALALVDQGVDFFSCYLNSAWEGVREACRQANCRMIEPILDRRIDDPVITASAVQNVGALYIQAVQYFARGELKGRRYRVGVENPEVERLALHSVPQEIAKEIEWTRSRILNHEIDILTAIE